MTPGFIYEGTIRHRRYAVRAHSFSHRIALLYLNVDSLDKLLDGRLESPRPGLVRFRRADYLGDPRRPLSSEVRDVVARATGSAPAGEVWLLTQPRILGLCFNPVSFYFCWEDPDRLGAVVAEVTNTPWRERHHYVLRAGSEAGVLGGEMSKQLHVSPFMAMGQTYSWRIAAPAQTLSAHIENIEAGELAFDATLALERRPLTKQGLRRMAWRFGFGSLRVLPLIYAHAAALKLKRVPLHTHPRIAS